MFDCTGLVDVWEKYIAVSNKDTDSTENDLVVVSKHEDNSGGDVIIEHNPHIGSHRDTVSYFDFYDFASDTGDGNHVSARNEFNVSHKHNIGS